MKITDVKPLIARGAVRNMMIVKIETDAGYYGWGESGLVGRELAVRGAVQHYREFLVGKDPRRIGALWQEMYRSQYFEGGRVLTAAISAIDLALARRGRAQPGRARLPAPRWGTARLGALLHHIPRGHGARCRRGRQEARGRRLALHPVHVRRARHGRRPHSLRATRVDSHDLRVDVEDAGGRRERPRPGDGVPPQAQRRGGGIVLPADAVRDTRLPRGADPGTRRPPRTRPSGA